MTIEGEKPFFYLNTSLDFVLKTPEISPGIREGVIDFLHAPENQKALIINTLQNALYGKSYSGFLWNPSNVGSSLRKMISNTDSFNSFIVPEQTLFFKDYSFNDVDTNNNFNLDSVTYLPFILPSNIAEKIKIDNLLERLPKWKVVIKSIQKDHMIALSPIDSKYDGEQLHRIFSEEGIKEYLDASQNFLLFNTLPTGLNKYVNEKQLTSYLIKLSNVSCIDHPNWFLYQNKYPGRIPKKINRLNVRNEIQNPQFHFLFDPRMVRNLSHFKPVVDEIRRVYGSEDIDESPCVITTDTYKHHDIYSIFLGISPQASMRSINIFKQGANDLEVIFPDFFNHLPNPVRIISIHDNNESLRGLKKFDLIFNYEPIFFRQTLNRDNESNLETMRHELVHQYFKEKWGLHTGNHFIDEGVAEFYGVYLGKTSNKVISQIASEILHKKDLLLNQNSGVFVYEAGLLFISFLLSKYGEQKLFDIYNHTALFIKKEKRSLIKMTDLDIKKVLPGNMLYQSLQGEFIDYLIHVSKLQ